MGFRKGKKKSSEQLPNPTLPPAPLPPLPGMPMPMPGAAPLPDLPVPEALPTPSIESLPDPLPVPEAEPQTDEEYNQLWAKKSDKPLPQIYGHIDRISSGEVGSLLDRYADRFGHSLDRDIIVLRKKEHDEKVAQIRDAPVVELVEEEVVEQSLSDKLSEIENQIRTLKPDYQNAKASGDSEALNELRPQLEQLMNERKSIKSQISSATPKAKAVAKPVAKAVAKAVVAEEATDGEDIFVNFVAIVDELLGSHLPEEVVSAFVESDDFSVYQVVGGDPSGADDELRGRFFAIVDGQLANMSEESIDAFVASSDFEIYRTVGEMY
uniref:Uncharacterized protein n=1 Tax=uncultured Poseidoniia archaeon TaxID=1697135 RepID=A0A1B1TCW2_9ARCH|nr:hypothetical protein MG2_1123 [uncultured Candidatus Thalassoarchaea sp.]